MFVVVGGAWFTELFEILLQFVVVVLHKGVCVVNIKVDPGGSPMPDEAKQNHLCQPQHDEHECPQDPGYKQVVRSLFGRFEVDVSCVLLLYVGLRNLIRPCKRNEKQNAQYNFDNRVYSVCVLED